MAEAVLVVREPDGTQKELRMRSRLIGGQTRFEEVVAVGAAETWVAYVNAVTPAANKHHLALFNATGSSKVVKVRKLFAVNLQTAAVTGVVLRFDVMRISAASAGTTITPVALDTDNAALPAQVTVRTGGAVTEGALLFPWICATDEETAVAALSKGVFQQWANIMLEGNEVQELTLREGQGVTVKQIPASAIGSLGWIVAFTVE